MNNFLDILKQAKVTEKDIELLQEIAILQNVKTNKILVDYGKKCTDIYLISVLYRKFF